MAKRKSKLDRVVRDMVDGLEVPKQEVYKGKKSIILTGDFVVIEGQEPLHGDRAFIVNGDEEDGYAFWVEITQVEL